jgi:predicted phosphodiesterase
MVWSLCILAAWMLQSSCLTAPGVVAPIPPEAAPVHRFWSPVYSRHFYTLDEAEKDKLVTRHAHVWTYEGAAFRAFPSPSGDPLAPVHRFWCGLLNAHFYTIDNYEANKLILDYPQVWTYEGIGFWAYRAGSQPVGTVPVHRFWSGALGTHFYTTSDRERFRTINSHADAWQYEGVAYYVYPQDDSSAVRIVKGPALAWVTPESVAVLWETDVPSDTHIGYGIGSAGREVWDPAFATLHKAVLSGLTPGTAYVYAAASGAASRTGSFTMAPQPGQPFRLAVYGDTRTYPAVHARVARNILESRPRLVLHTGDLVGAGRDLHTWETEFFEPAGELMAGVPVVPVPGNHEYFGSGPPWFFYFFDRPVSESWFALTCGNARIIGLDTSISFNAGSPQHDWLLGEFPSVPYRDATWHIIILHEPPFTATAGRGDSIAVRDQLVPLFEQYGVDVVFSGHSHAYERYLHSGISYIVTGGGGAPLYPLLPDLTSPVRQFGRSEYHHCIVDIDPTAGTLTISAVDITGGIFDSVELVK